jgi:predicted patatin/cPLA2 family phospholipase
VTLEQKEKELYDKIVALGLKEIDEIKQLSAEAIKVVDERRSRLEKENESIQLSKAEFEKSTEIVNEINDEELKNEATALLKLMTDRYTAYNKLYDAYSISLAHDKELYIMFQSEDLTLEQLELQIESINRSYEEVISLNETFNSLTSEYNEKKKEFYQKAGLEVSVKEETP